MLYTHSITKNLQAAALKRFLFHTRKRVLTILKEMLVLPNTPLSLISQLVERLLSIIHDDQQRITTVCVSVSDWAE